MILCIINQRKKIAAQIMGDIDGLYDVYLLKTDANGDINN